jgi:peptide/nickel transport system substrate-binding protein
MAVRAGDIDYASLIDDQWLAKVTAGKDLFQPLSLDKENLNLLVRPGFPYTIYLNCHPQKGNSPFKDERVRKAMDLCLDRPRIASTLWGTLGTPIDQGFDPKDSPWGFEDIGYPEANIPKAKQLLTEAGCPNGLEVNFSITTVWGKQDLLAQIVQQMARPAGFRIKIIPEVGVEYWKRLRTMNYHLLHYGMGGEDPMGFYYNLLHTDPASPWDGYSPNLGVKDPELDKLLDEVAAEDNFAKRKKIFKKVVLRVKEKAYLLPYVTVINARVWTKKLQNYKPLEYFYSEEALAESWLES